MTDRQRAAARLAQGDVTLVLCRGERMHTDTRRGVAPLLALLDAGEDVVGWSAADKVVGAAAAFLYGLLEVAAVDAPVISRPATAVLDACGIPWRAECVPEGIRNRAGDGPCPMESAVAGITDPVQALAAIRERLARLRQDKT